MAADLRRGYGRRVKADESPFHPDLARLGRMAPRGIGRPWLRPPVAGLMGVLGRLPRPGKTVKLQHSRVIVHGTTGREDHSRPALLWLHGSGMIGMGQPHEWDAQLVPLTKELGLISASATYRAAPRHPYPAALDDAEAAFDWLSQHPEVDPTRIAIGGGSAGGGLAAALAIRLRDRGGITPIHQTLIYPMLDDRSAAITGPNDRNFRIWDRRSNEYGWSSYLQGVDRERPPGEAVPGRAPDLSGLPPAWIGVGTLDLFHDECLSYAQRLGEAGVPVTQEVVEGAFHGFDLLAPKAPVVRDFLGKQRDAVAAAIQGDAR